MITERDEQQRNDRAPLAWSLLVSTVFNLLLWAAVTGRWGMFLHTLVREQKPQEFIVSSSALEIERKPRPVPQHSRSIPQPQQRPKQQQAPVQPRHAEPQAQPTEIARIVPNASPQPRSVHERQKPESLAQQLAQQQQMFAREAQQLHQSNAPLSIATPNNFKPSSFQRSYMDLNGRDARESVTALLMPLPGKHWYANGMSCYYVHYYAQFSGGGTEDGNIPWPVCYPANHDAMLPLDRPHELPVPAPPVGFTLPSTAALGPLLREIYTGKIH